MKSAIIYTDGACEPNPGPGGWAAIIIVDGVETELTGADRLSTNNRMELTGPLRALEWCLVNNVGSAIIHSDSQYVVNSMSRWVYGWEHKGWVKPHANRELIQEIHATQKRLQVTWRWVRGHAGNRYNERCDRLAVAASKSNRGNA